MHNVNMCKWTCTKQELKQRYSTFPSNLLINSLDQADIYYVFISLFVFCHAVLLFADINIYKLWY